MKLKQQDAEIYIVQELGRDNMSNMIYEIASVSPDSSLKIAIENFSPLHNCIGKFYGSSRPLTSDQFAIDNNPVLSLTIISQQLAP